MQRSQTSAVFFNGEVAGVGANGPTGSNLGGWTNPFEKYISQNGFMLLKFRGENRGENKKNWGATTYY